MVGGSILTFLYEWKCLKSPDHDRLAREIANTITVNKSLAVVLGVAPLLTITLLYAIHFYTANALTGTAWLMLTPLVTMTFLLLYFHKYSWDAMQNHRELHVALAGFIVLLFLCIPFILLVQANLMLFPEHWGQIRGFFPALILPNVFPRYLHFMAASVSLTALFLVAYLGRRNFPVESVFTGFTRPMLKKKFYALSLETSLIQFILGPIVLLTLPSHGINAYMLFILAGGIAFSIPAFWLMWREIKGPDAATGRYFPLIVMLLFSTVVCMGTARHSYRAWALAPHKKAMAGKTVAYEAMVRKAESDSRNGVETASQGKTSDSGKTYFTQYCSACHAVDIRLIGPPVTEIAAIYKGNPEGIVTWAKAPGKKRAGFIQMPAFNQVDPQELLAIARYMLEIGSNPAHK
jgi:cytochrome c